MCSTKPLFRFSNGEIIVEQVPGVFLRQMVDQTEVSNNFKVVDDVVLIPRWWRKYLELSVARVFELDTDGLLQGCASRKAAQREAHRRSEGERGGLGQVPSCP